MKILIGGDVCPINSNKKLFLENDAHIFGELQSLFKQSDLNIINLEIPLTDSHKSIIKSGANLKGSPKSLKALKNSNVDIVSLANNHLGDFGKKGVLDTLSHCESLGIKTVGAGKNLADARTPLITTVNQRKIAVLSLSDIEFGMATEVNPGANPLDLKILTLQLIDIKEKVDFCIVLLHEGKEHYEYPSPELQSTCRFICDLGANLVVCQHSHISGAVEKYNNSNIIYGQGNLLFDYKNRKSDSWINGFLISLDISKDQMDIELIPFKQTFPGIVPLDKVEEKAFKQKMKLMSHNVLDKNFIENSWLEFIKKYEKTYYSIFRGHNKIQRKIFSYLPFHEWFYNKSKNAILLNVIRSRVHREAIIDLLNDKINRI